MELMDIGTSPSNRALAGTLYQEPLAQHLALTMVQIPSSVFQMGSALEAGRGWEEGPQHGVILGTFWLAQTPITQAQWQEVAGWDQVKRALHPDPATFKGAHRPVEQVSWHDCLEFCLRLSRRTGRRYALPSEAQWEYACRAGSSTPFHFGPTLTPEQANYDSNGSYAKGPKSPHRQQTTDVGRFPANAFGLHDMHGNVWEWCADNWHSSYVNAPSDGQPWLSSGAANHDPKLRVLRGGSWASMPGYCRSAYRNNALSSLTCGTIGFRVCCLPDMA
jgi:formylglycine-generating enzyme required for sulfatase activity